MESKEVMHDLPIGVFDSGVGGLTVMRELVKALPHESILYLGDTLHLPFGDKSPQDILAYTQKGAQFLIRKGIKLLIIACHTASCIALTTLQRELPIPVIGMLEAGVEGVKATPAKARIALLGTTVTISSGIYQKLLLEQLAPEAIFPVACPLFVPLIEEGLKDHQALPLIVSHYLAPLKEKNIDAALLACTHYPLIAESIAACLEVPLVEPAFYLAKIVKNKLKTDRLFTSPLQTPSYRFFSTDDGTKFRKLAPIFFPPLSKQVFHLETNKAL